MTCPNCGSENYRVIETIPGLDGNIYRRRKCIGCGCTFRTVETPDDGSEEFKQGYYEAMKRKQLLYEERREGE